jgi:hypothetical protein
VNSDIESEIALLTTGITVVFLRKLKN